MMCALPLACAVVVLFAAGPPAAPSAARLTMAPDSAPEAAVLAEVRALYRDLDARRWTPLLDHFLPAKVTARWAPPVASDAWSRLAAPAPITEGTAGATVWCEPRAAVAIVGDWARVRVRRCAQPADEAWLLRASGRWKIVHLELAQAAAESSGVARASARAAAPPNP